MAVKVREKEVVNRGVTRHEARRGQAGPTILERPRWSEDLARPPYEPRESRVAEVEQR
jgi:hypothetical protein